MADVKELRQRLLACPAGHAGWAEFEQACTEILVYLFVPPLQPPKTQARTFSGIDRRDAVFPNRNLDATNNWGRFYKELDARMILFEFKNYDAKEIGKDETVQTRSYLKKPMGRLAVMCCNRMPDHAAHIKRNSIFSEDKTVILFLTKDLLLEMILIKERGEDPADLLMDLLERFYLQHE